MQGSDLNVSAEDVGRRDHARRIFEAAAELFFFQNSDKQSTISVRRAASGLAEDCEAKDLCLPQYSLNFLIYMCKVFKIRKFKDGPRRHAATCQELTTKTSIRISRLVFV